MLYCSCNGQLTLSLEEQSQNLKVSVRYSAQGALPVCFTFPGGVVIAVHRCLAVNCIGIHWLQQNRVPLSAAVVMEQAACSVAAEWPNRKLPERPYRQLQSGLYRSVCKHEQCTVTSIFSSCHMPIA